MSSSILHELTADKMSQQIPLPILEACFPRDLICQVLTDTNRWEKRERKLSHLFLMYLLIAWTILPPVALKEIGPLLTAAIRWLAPDLSASFPGASALSYRRQTLGEKPLQELVARACVPLCSAGTLGASFKGLLLIAIDSKLLDVVDTPDTDRTFRGRDATDQPRVTPPSPQLRLVSALEVGSHAHVGAVLAPGYQSEMSQVENLLPFLPANSLVLQDSGFRGAWWIQRLKQHGHDSITRVQSTDYLCRTPRLADGSYLVTITKSCDVPLPEPLTLRIIEYRLAPEVAEKLATLRKSRSQSGTHLSPGPDSVYRLATTLLDPEQYPAQEIAACYHERWEVELVYDELQEDQLSTPKLLSKTSTMVYQEALAMILGHYAVRSWMMQAAKQGEVLDVDRLSFTHALTVLGTALTLSPYLQQTETEVWKPRVLQDLRRPESVRSVERRMRCYPRVVKTTRSRFFQKKATDVPFVLKDRSRTWEQLLILVGVPQPQEVSPILLI